MSQSSRQFPSRTTGPLGPNATIFSKKIICLFLHLGCTVTDPYSGSCCNFLPEKCGRNEGDCDSDADCKAGLSCGIDNCPAWGNFHHDADCCFNVTGIIFIPYFTQLCLQ